MNKGLLKLNDLSKVSQLSKMPWQNFLPVNTQHSCPGTLMSGFTHNTAVKEKMLRESARTRISVLLIWRTLLAWPLLRCRCFWDSQSRHTLQAKVTGLGGHWPFRGTPYGILRWCYLKVALPCCWKALSAHVFDISMFLD